MANTDKTTFAENPGKVKLSSKKWKQILDILNLDKNAQKYYKKQISKVKSYLAHGDTQVAIVMKLEPLLIATYSDEMDAIIMLKFPTIFKDIYNLEIGMVMATNNVYWPKNMFDIASDIFVGEYYGKVYRDVIPLISLFFAKDEEVVANNLKLLKKDLIERAKVLSVKYLEEHQDLMRDGFFYLIN